jgi:drug/metabolite transporter (DMT)-like permease
MSLNLQRLLFIVLCVVWGLTWPAMRVGAQSVPPALFSGLRWLAAGAVLLAWRQYQGRSLRVPTSQLARMAAVALLMIVGNAMLNLYGLRHVGAGLGAVINSVLTPIALLGFAIFAGQERFSVAQARAIAVGIAGVLLLFGARAFSGQLGVQELVGVAEIILACLAYCGGSVIARPLMRVLSPAEVGAFTNVMGGAALLAGSLLFEPGSWEGLSGHWGVNAWAAWLFLLLAGSLGASIIYFMLVREWGASGAGTYAFVSPVISVAFGILVLGETVSSIESAGMALMLVAAAMVLYRKTPVTI